MNVRLLYFADLRDLCGVAEETFECAEMTTMQGLWTALQERHPALNNLNLPILPVLDRRRVPWTEPVVEGAEISFLTPVSGG